MTRRSERLINALREGWCPNLLGIFTFAAAVSLPLDLILALVALAYAADWPTRRSHGGALFKHVFTAAVIVIGCYGAAIVLSLVDGLAAVAAAAATFVILNIGLIAAALWVAGARQVLRMFRSVRAHATDVATQAAGALVAIGIEAHLATAMAVLPAIYGFQRLSIAGRVAEAVPINRETGLWTERAWSVLLAEAIAEGKRFAVFVIDPDDRRTWAPRRVFETLEPSLSSATKVGQLVGGQVVLLMPEMTLEVARILALRYAARLAEVGLPVVVGTAAGGWSGGPDQHDVMISALSGVVTRRSAQSSARPG